jgi:uncharacterized protein (TIGR02118 family)
MDRPHIGDPAARAGNRVSKPMHCLTVTYPAPNDAARFKAYYEATHLPLARQFPGLKSWSFAYPEPLGPGSAPFCIFQAWFDDRAAMLAALQSEIGQKVVADVPNFASAGATVFHFAAEV